MEDVFRNQLSALNSWEGYLADTGGGGKLLSLYYGGSVILEITLK